MAEDIAVFVGENGLAASLYEAGKLIVFSKRLKQWQPVRKLDFTLAGSRTMVSMRQKMSEALAFLDNCKIFVGQTVTGLPYFELEKGAISIWEFEGVPLEFLEYVWEKECEAAAAAKAPAEKISMPVPVDLGNGYFMISLVDIQKGDSAVTSKQVLLPFLQQANFYELAVTCRHVPPWLELELAGNQFTGKIEKVEDKQYLVTITCKACSN